MASRSLCLYLDIAIFKVEDELFRVPTYYLKAKSSIFHGMFTLPSGEGESAEGMSDDNPIELKGVSKVDFQRFLYVILQLQVDKQLEYPGTYWLSVLKLANLWGFSDLRAMAIKEISPKDLTSVDKVVYGRTYKVEAWLLDGYFSMVERDSRLTELEVGQLGWHAALKICNLREDKLLARIAVAPPPSFLNLTSGTPLPRFSSTSTSGSTGGSAPASTSNTAAALPSVASTSTANVPSTSSTFSFGLGAPPVNNGPFSATSSSTSGRATLSSQPKTLRTLVREAFADELKDVRDAGSALCVPPPLQRTLSPPPV